MSIKRKNKDDGAFIALDSSMQSELSQYHKSKKKNGNDFTSNKPGVVFLRHIPHGFYESEMKRYFSQFGEVTRLRLARSKKTHRSRGYAFIEFACDEVAKVAAETMNNYLMFEHILKCEVIPEEKVSDKMFNGMTKYVKPFGRERALRVFENRSMEPRAVENRRLKIEKKRTKIQKTLESMGIDYDISNLSGNPNYKPKSVSKAAREEIEERAESSDDKTIRKEFEEMMEEFDFYEFEKGTPGSRKRSSRNAFYREKEEEHDSGIDGEVPKKGENKVPKKKDAPLEEPSSSDAKDRFDEELVEDMKGCLNDLNATPEMVVDCDDSEITFKTPPQKVRKRSLTSKKAESGVSPKTEVRELIRVASLKKKVSRKRKLLEMKKKLNMTM